MIEDNGYQYDIDGDITYIYFTQENGMKHVVIIDTFNLERVINYKYRWHVSEYNCNNFYARANVYKGYNEEKGRGIYETLLLHTFIANNPDAKYIDHKNNNRLDERESNLRVTEQKNNTKNRKGKNINNTSGYRNVSLINGWYRIQLQINGTNYLFPEKFKDVDEAGKFAEEMRLKYYGEYAGHN